MLLFLLLPSLATVLGYFSENEKVISGVHFFFAVIGLATSFYFSLDFFASASLASEEVITWLNVGEIRYHFALRYGELAALMIPLLFFCASLIYFYAFYYFEKAAEKKRFFSLTGLFTAGMSGLFLADTWLQFLFFWEFIGIISFLLVVFEHSENLSASNAFYVLLLNKIADIGLWLLVLWLIRKGDMRISETKGVCEIMLFAGIFSATGKSAQFPFSSWLLSAMTAPAPASALIHAATLVTSGVVLLYHLSPSFTASVQDVLLFLGLLTSIWGSISALHAGNVKQVLASSTVSQLGLMSATLALGGGKLVLLFLVAHGFFKAGLFLSAGVLMKGNAEHTLNKEAFGGLFRTNKVFGVLFAIFLLSACGMPFFSGYYVKERILHLLVERGDFLAYFFMPLAFFLTSFYASVLYLKIFTGAEKGFISNEKTKKMLLPVGFLAFLSFWLFFGANPFGDFYEIYGLKPYSGNFGILAAGLLINLAGFSAGYFSLRAGIDFSRFIPDALSRSALFFNFCGANFFAASCAYCETSFKKLLFKHYQTRFSESDYEIFYEEKRVFFSTLLVRTAQKLSRADGVLTLSKDVIFEMAFILAYIGGKFDDAVLDGIVRFIYGAVGSGNRIFGRLQGRRAARYMLFALVSLVLLVLAIILASCRLV